MKKMMSVGLCLTATLALATVASAAPAGLHQTLVLARATDSLKIYGATVEQRENRILSPVVAMTEKAAAILVQMAPGVPVRCDVSALQQDYGKNTRDVVWSIYSIDMSSCVLTR